MGDKEQWYTNKDLFELINRMQGDFRDLRSEMRETRAAIKKYNGLREEVGQAREEVGQIKEQVKALQAKAEGRFSVWEGIRNWGGWIVAILALIVTAATKL